MKKIHSLTQVILIFLFLSGIVTLYSQAPGVKNTVKIGLLIQTNNTFEAKNGAELAIEKANKNGGYAGRDFELIVKSMEGPWGTGSKQAVDMIFNDRVVAIIGSHDGRNAHLVEQATTKAHIVFLSAWAGDPTLSQAFTPWFFNCVPNDNQQAEKLVYQIMHKKFRKVLIVTDSDYDANSALKSFMRKSAELNLPVPDTIAAGISEKDIFETAASVIRMNPGCLLLFTKPVSAEILLERLNAMGYSGPVYGPLSVIGESPRLLEYAEGLENLLLLTSGNWFLKENSEFAASYQKKYRAWPGARAAYAYDAVSVLINNIRELGDNRETLHKDLINSVSAGVTGTIKFDEKGNRKNTVASPEL
jgi:branched-chain amino acid transport system substrate-binding protein